MQTAHVIRSNVSLHVKSIYHHRQAFSYQKSGLLFFKDEVWRFYANCKVKRASEELLIKFLDTENLEPTKQLLECRSGDTSTLLMNASIRYVPSGKFHFLRLFFINIAALHVF